MQAVNYVTVVYVIRVSYISLLLANWFYNFLLKF